MNSSDDEVTPEEFDAAFAAGTPVQLEVGRLRIVTDVEENARLHIHTLLAAHWTQADIARTAGVAEASLSYFLHGRKGRPNGNIYVAERVLRVRPDDIPPGRVSRVGTVRRIQALMVMGWTHAEMCRRLGYKSEKATSVLLAQPGEWVTRATHDAVAALYRELSHQRGPSERGRKMALRRGYAGPFRWDDIDHDEAPEKSDEYCVEDGCFLKAVWAQPSSTMSIDSEAGQRCQKHGRQLRRAA